MADKTKEELAAQREQENELFARWEREQEEYWAERSREESRKRKKGGK